MGVYRFCRCAEWLQLRPAVLAALVVPTPFVSASVRYFVKTMRINGGLALILVGLLFGGCATSRSYLRIPSSFTTVSAGPNYESYLIELDRPTGEPTATRYEFTIESGSVTATISKISRNGARSERRRSDETAKRLLQIFRGFNWGSIEAPLPDDDTAVSVSEDTEIILKARTQKSYREVQVRLSDCAPIRKLLQAIEAVK